jgi:hypothetical protein
MTDLRLQRLRYSQHKRSAKQRGIEFRLTFEEWWKLWEPHWENRGSGHEQLVMCRFGDKGGYEVGNVRIATVRENAKTRGVVAKTHAATPRNRSDELEWDEEGWLPKELQNPYRSAMNF